LLGGFLGWFYTAPPLKLAYRGLGEISTMLAVGLIMPGMGYLVATGNLDSLFQLFILPLSCYGLFFIITVESPDVESDALGDKKNILVKWGSQKGKLFSVLATVIGTLLLTLMYLFGFKNEIIDWKPFIFFSIFPLLASISSYLMKRNSRTIIEKQVIVNMTSMILFLLLMNISLIVQYIL
jgi:1,4-dihydroxy-2-naphthoate octaprenyltransferase